ncbi:MAG: serine/threonine-protein phosphatase [Anaerolineae bacterium]|nr:serine/threonine-protein phosphatase [Anaerolineae bacterium]
MELDIGFSTDPGPREGVNQDSILVTVPERHPGTVLLIVADGMGGARAGDRASQMAIAIIERHILEDEIPNPDNATERLREAIVAANARIYHQAKSTPEMKGMGCTVVAVLVLGDMYWVASVGDSRVYLIRDEEVFQLTEDHTWVNARVREGVLTPEQAARHSLRHVLDRALGTQPTIDVDIWPDEIFEDGDILVMCTDGLYGVLDDEVIAETAASNIAQRAADELVSQALVAQAQDNISVIVLQAKLHPTSPIL